MIFFARLPQLFKAVTENAAPATIFDAVSCLRGPDIAIHGESILDTSHHAAPATQMQNAALQSAAPATRKRRACILTRVKSIAPVTQNAKMTCHLVILKHQNEHFVRDFPQISHVKRNLPKHFRKLSRMAVN